MKKVFIAIQIERDEIKTAIRKSGFEKNVSSELEVLGALENLISIQREKINQNVKTFHG